MIVSDGGSSDGTPARVRALYPDVVLIDNPIDPGYSVATNRGVDAGTADLVVLLNNDAYCRPDFLEHVIAAFELDERIGAVAPLTLRPDERTIDSVGLALDVTLAQFIRLNGEPLSSGPAQCGHASPRLGVGRTPIGAARGARPGVSTTGSRSTVPTSTSRFGSAPSVG